MRHPQTRSDQSRDRIDAFDVKVPRAAWLECGDVGGGHPASRLLATAIINGHYFHMEAIQMRGKPDKDGIRRAANPAFEDLIEHACAINDAACETQRIGRRAYVIVITPYEG